MSFVGGAPLPALTQDQIYDLAIKHGFKPGREAQMVSAIAMAESRGVPNNFNPDDPHGGSVGLLQINGANAPLIGGESWKIAGTDPDASMAAAHELYAKRGNFTDWGTFTNGAYKQYAGTTLNTTGPVDASIIARGGVSPSPIAVASSMPQTVAPPGPPPPTLGQNIQKGDVGAALAQLTAGKKDAAGDERSGTSVIDKLAGLTKPKEQQQSQSSSPMLQPQDSMAQIAPAAQQLMASTFLNSAKPLSWSASPYGSGLAGPIVPGTTLSGVPQNVYG